MFSITLFSTVVASAAAFSGQATFYGGNTEGGTCSFANYTLPAGLYGTALSDSNWEGSEACGGCIEVTGPNGNTITAMITDQCPGCGTNHLDLYHDAFNQLAETSQGIIDVTWDYVQCPISSALKVHMKEGVSANWFSAQVVNAGKRTADLQVSSDGGKSWTGGLTRQTYNYFELSSGTGSDLVAIKVESVDGDQVIVENVAVTGGHWQDASANY